MSRDTEIAERDLLNAAYRDFNARHIDQLLASLHPNVEWANGWEGGHVHGHEAVHAYWMRQFEVLDPHVEPLDIEQRENGTQLVKVHQVVRNREGELLADTLVYHSFQFAEGLIVRMDIIANAPQQEEVGLK